MHVGISEGYAFLGFEKLSMIIKNDICIMGFLDIDVYLIERFVTDRDGFEY